MCLPRKATYTYNMPTLLPYPIACWDHLLEHMPLRVVGI